MENVFEDWILKEGQLDEDEPTLYYKGLYNGKQYEGYIVNLEDITELSFNDIEKHKEEILSKMISKIITKPRFNELPKVLQDMYRNHGHSQVYMIYYEEDSYEEDMEDFTSEDIKEANEFMDKHFECGCYEEFIEPKDMKMDEEPVVTMYGNIWEQVDFSDM